MPPPSSQPVANRPRLLRGAVLFLAGLFAVWSWYDGSLVVEADPIAMPAEERARDDADHRLPVVIVRVSKPRWVFRPVLGGNRPTMWLAAGVVLLGSGTTLLARAVLARGRIRLSPGGKTSHNGA